MPGRMHARNELKRKTLAAIANKGPITAPDFAVLLHFRPIRAAHSYLRRLQTYGLLSRDRTRGGRFVYAISDRGRDRLEWLETKKEENAAQQVQ